MLVAPFCNSFNTILFIYFYLRINISCHKCSSPDTGHMASIKKGYWVEMGHGRNSHAHNTTPSRKVTSETRKLLFNGQ